jgi:hypothetical protein
MIPVERARLTAKKLLEKTRADQVKWEKDSGQRFGASFVMAFPKSSIRLTFISPTAEPDTITLYFFDENGSSVGSWSVEEGSEPDWQLLNDLLAEANRSATGWDKVLEDVERALDADVPTEKVRNIPF